ncbi:MAG: MucB/RseB C-terminal domain-containing protein [Pseudomonadota bacterium]
MRNNPKPLHWGIALSLLTCLGPVTYVHGDEVTRGWLDRMGRAVEELSYQGSFVHTDGGRSQSMGVAHRVDDGNVYERLWSLDGPNREFIRKNNEVKCIFSDHREVVFEQVQGNSGYGLQVPEFSPALERLYRLVSHDEEERIAGRSTQVVEIIPEDRYRYGYKMWLDIETAMPLRFDLVNEKGEAVETTQFIGIDFREVEESELTQELSVEGYRHHAAASNGAADSNIDVPWQVGELPPGFYRTSATKDDLPNQEGELTHMTYSDGLATVSVFVEPLGDDDQPVLRGLSKKMNAYGIVARGADGNYQVTVMGEVPRLTLRNIGESIRQTH